MMHILTARQLAIEICRKERLDYNTVFRQSKKLLERYCFACGKPDDMSPEEIKQHKQEIRRKYINIIKKKGRFTEEDYEDFIWDVVRAPWFEAKSEMILDERERMLDGEISKGGFDYEKDRDHEGKRLRIILKERFLRGKNNIKSEETIGTIIGVCRATVFRKEPAAIVLFGALMWRYAMKRELEDIAAGIVTSEESSENEAVYITKMQPVTE